MIVKVQRSISSSAGVDTVLIYDQARTHLEVRALDKELTQKMGSAYKCYFQAELHKGSLKLGKRTRSQNW